MKLAKFAESDRGKKLFRLLVTKGRHLGLILYCIGIGVYCLFPAEGYHRKFRDSSLLSRLRSQYLEHYKNSDLQAWIEGVMIEFGLEVSKQNYSAEWVVSEEGSEQHHGTNVFGILRAGRSSSVEAIVLTAPDVLASGGESLGVPVLLALAKFFSNKNYLAKDVIFLVTSGGVVGMQSWVNAYLGVQSSVVTADPLPSRSGSIQAVVNIEIGRGNIAYINGVNAVLPNLDLVFVASSLCEMEGLPITYHVNWDSPGVLNPRSPYFSSLLMSAAVLFHQATGLPLTNHAPFLSHRIDSVTLRGIHRTREDNTYQLKDLARALEGIFRNINNLLERLHHSEFFYINMSQDTFVSIGQYSSFFGLLLAPLLSESLRQWLLGRGVVEVEGELSHGKSFYERMGIPASFTFNLKPLSVILVWSLGTGSILYYSPSLMKYMGVPLTAETLFGGVTTVWLITTAAAIFVRSCRCGHKQQCIYE